MELVERVNKKGKKVIFHIESALVVKYQMIK